MLAGLGDLIGASLPSMLAPAGLAAILGVLWAFELLSATSACVHDSFVQGLAHIFLKVVFVPGSTFIAGVPCLCGLSSKLLNVDRNSLAFAMNPSMNRCRQKVKVPGLVVGPVLVGMVNLEAVWHFASVDALPNCPMQPDAFALEIWPASVVPNAVEFLNGVADDVDLHVYSSNKP